MIELGASLLSWWLTAWLHLTLLLALVWALEKSGALCAPAMRQSAWRLALLAPLLTASVQLLWVERPLAGWHALWTLPSAAVAPKAAAAPRLPVLANASALRLVAPLPAPTAASGTVARKWAALGGYGWTLLAALSLLRVVACWRREQARIRMLAPIADEELLRSVQALADAGGLGRLRLRLDPAIASPAACSEATLILPAWALQRLSPRQRRAMLAHEVAHLARRDPQWRLVYALHAAVFPAPWIIQARARLVDLAEHACDAWSARVTGERRALAEALASCAEFAFSGRATPVFAAPMAHSRSALVERVQRLIEDQPMHFERLTQLPRAALGIALLVGIAALPGIRPLQSAAAESNAAPPAMAPATPAPPAAPAPPAPPAASSESVPPLPAPAPPPPPVAPPAPPEPPDAPTPPDAPPAPPAPPEELAPR